MPTNLPPEYFEIEKDYRAAETPEEKARYLEELISAIPKHKGTDKLRAGFRRRLSKLKAAAQTRKGSSKRSSAFLIDRAGAGQVAVIGPPNTGKSALVAALTNADPQVSDAPLSTWEPTPGMMPVDNVQIQMIDTPPLTTDYIEPGMRELALRSDLILIVVDLETAPVQQLQETVEMLHKMHIAPVHLKERYAGERRLNFKPFLVLANKCDDEEGDELFEICCEINDEDWPMTPGSAKTGYHIGRFKQMVYDGLDIIRVYSKPPGEEPNRSRPFVLPSGSTVEDFAGKVHQDFLQNLKNARVWGQTVFDGQQVGRDYVLQDGDVVELHT